MSRENTLRWMCEQKGLSFRTFTSRYYMYGWTLDRALNEPALKVRNELQERRKNIYNDYKTHEYSYQELADKYNIKASVIRSIVFQMKRKEIK